MISLALWNLRSVENVASILRTADGFGVQSVYFIGTTPHPTLKNDPRLPHVRAKMDRVFAKTSLGAEQSLALTYCTDFTSLRALLPAQTQIIALEQTKGSHILPNLPQLAPEILLVVGEERHGLPPEVLALADSAIEIPMFGAKESFNVSVATGIALYALAT
jgi:tRNA G18 (ribose-2'-O)-methylase SpoU